MADASFREQLQDEIETWRQEGIIGPRQVQRILAHYGLATLEAEQARSQGRLSAILECSGPCW